MNGAAIPWRTFGRVLNQLENINLVSNNLTGRITADIGDLKNLTAVRLDGNRIDGTIPAAVGRIDHLQILRVAGNTNMTGFLPPSMASMAHLQWLDINGTSITGDISTAPLPKNITTCNLSPLFCVPTAFEAPVGAKYMTPCGLLTACNSTDADEVGLLPTAVSMNRTSPSPFVSPSPLAVINGTAGVNGTTPGWNLTELIGNAGNRTDLTSPSPLVSPSQSPLVLPSPSPSPSPSPLRPPSPMNPPPAVILTAALPTPENKILAPSPSPEASPSSSSSSSSPVPAVVGTIAVIAVAVVAILVVLMYKRRGQRGDSSNGEDGPSPGRDYDIQLKSIKEVKEFGSDGDRDDMERVRREVLGATRTRDGNLAVAAEGEEIGSVRRRLGSDVRSEVSEEEKEEFGVRVSPFVDPDARRTNPFTDGAEMGIVGRRRMLEPLSVVVHPRDPVNRGFEERETR
ncbi:hypothetical protein BC829DRAFT_391264 [Chytridium lagenaria]|nr:hypothetical protein BC829DRAFT_391264 [Chytridium lagenaria]